MSRLSSSTFSNYSPFVTIIFILTLGLLVNGGEESSFFTTEFQSSYPAICDRQYRSKYFANDAHQAAVRDGRLFVEPKINPHDVYRKPFSNIYGDIHNEMLPSNNDYASQFLPIDLNPGPEYMMYGYNERSEFMDDEDYRVKRFSKPIRRSFTDVHTKFTPNGRYVSSPRFMASRVSSPEDKLRATARLLTKLSAPPRFANEFHDLNGKIGRRRYLSSPKFVDPERFIPRKKIIHNHRRMSPTLSGPPFKRLTKVQAFDKKEEKYSPSLSRRFYNPARHFNESYELKKTVGLSGTTFWSPKIFGRKVNNRGMFFPPRYRLSELQRQSLRKDRLKIKRNNEAIGFYKMEDTFRPIIEARRAENPASAINETIKKSRSQDKCKAMRRIVSGYDVESPERFPYMVFVDTGCGGSIISDVWVLTAAHCIDLVDPVYVHVGSNTLMAGCQYNVVHVYIHPQYSRKSLEFDVGLIKVDPPFVFSPAIKPIQMSSVRALRKMCGTVAGWGAVEFHGPPKVTLSMTTIPVVARKKCRQLHITQSQFCAGYDDGSSDACQGDSGGAFVVDDRLVGIVSFGYKCAVPNKPGVYVDVSYIRDWIRGITGI